jgi:Mg2+ and Co2+ transporter CorA
MVPVFTIEPLPMKVSTPRGLSARGSSFLSSVFSSCFRRGSRADKARISDFSGEEAINDRLDDDGLKIGKIRIQMTSIFVNVPTNDTIITYNNDRTSGDSFGSDCWLRVQKELGKGYSKLRQYDAQYLTYALLDRAVDLIDPIVRQLRKELSHEKQDLPETNYQSLERVHQLREQLENVVRKLKPFMRLLVHVIEDDAISPGATVYLRDVLDNLECHDDEVKYLILECQTLDADAEKFQSRKMDQTLYTLTVISAIFLPAQFLTGVWGMNFEHMPELDETWGYAMFWGVAVFMSMTLLCVLDFGRFRN